jgi:Chalcone isomerase-like
MAKIIGLILVLFTLSLNAATLDNITFADKVNIEGKELVLNGIGIRKATFLKIKVYYGALYLEQKTNNAAAFLSTAAPKQIVMHFVRDVGAKKLQDGFNEGMEASNKNHESFKAQMAKFNANLVDVVKDDLIIITFTNDGVSLNVKGKQSEKIASAEFSKALLRIWFIEPRDENLQNGLLGK